MVFFAIIIPWLASSTLIFFFRPSHSPGGLSLALGYGYLFGAVGTTLILRFQSAMGLRLEAWVPIFIFLIIFFAIVFKCKQQGFFTHLGIKRKISFNLDNLTFLFFLGLILLRLVNLALEVWWLPLIPWDAWTTWAARARTWTMLGELVPFVSQEQWSLDNKPYIYTIDAYQYPLTVSLIATWPNLAYGSWNETIANLPWLGAGVAIGLSLYGQSRIWGCSGLTAIVFVYICLSIPFLNTHIALAGYADIWVALSLGLGFMAFLGWIRTGEVSQGILAGVSLFAGILMKREVLIWVTLLIFAYLPIYFRKFLFIIFIYTIFFLAISFVFIYFDPLFYGLDLNNIDLNNNIFKIPFIGDFEFSYHSVWRELTNHIFIYGNWHFFPYLFLMAFSVSIITIGKSQLPTWQILSLTWFSLISVALYILFFWTQAYNWVIQGTIVNRLFLHFIPALVFWTMCAFLEVKKYLLPMTEPKAD